MLQNILPENGKRVFSVGVPRQIEWSLFSLATRRKTIPAKGKTGALIKFLIMIMDSVFARGGGSD